MLMTLYMCKGLWGARLAPVIIVNLLLYVPFFVHRSRKLTSSTGTIRALGGTIRALGVPYGTSLNDSNFPPLRGGVQKHRRFIPPIATLFLNFLPYGAFFILSLIFLAKEYANEFGFF